MSIAGGDELGLVVRAFALLSCGSLALAFLALGLFFLGFAFVLEAAKGLAHGSGGNAGLLFYGVIESGGRLFLKGYIGIVL